MRKRFVVIDYDPEIIDQLDGLKVNYLYGDATDIELLEEAGLDKTKLLVSTLSDHAANIFLIDLLQKFNPRCVVILHAETIKEAMELYERGAMYVILPHHLGSEHIGAFIRRNGLKKHGFQEYRQKHLDYLQQHYSLGKDA